MEKHFQQLVNRKYQYQDIEASFAFSSVISKLQDDTVGFPQQQVVICTEHAENTMRSKQ